jgi:hypothetical protein
MGSKPVFRSAHASGFPPWVGRLAVTPTCRLHLAKATHLADSRGRAPRPRVITPASCEVPMLRHGVRSSAFHCACALCCVLILVPSLAIGQEPPAAQVPPAKTAAAPRTSEQDDARREAFFRTLMTNVKLSGQFTIEGGKEGALFKDDYVISSAVKLGKGDLWLLTSRIRYGKVDLTVPVPVAVKWAGETPVITLDDVSIPGLGNFSAHIVLDRGKYAGTWTHDDKGGHMFGIIQPVAAVAPATTPEPVPGQPSVIPGTPKDDTSR